MIPPSESSPPRRVAGVLIDFDDAALLVRAIDALGAGQWAGRSLSPTMRRIRDELAAACGPAYADTRTEGPHDLLDALSRRDYYSPVEAARVLDCTPANVRDLCRRGVLDGRRVSGRWLVYAEDVDRRAHHRKQVTPWRSSRSTSTRRARI